MGCRSALYFYTEKYGVVMCKVEFDKREQLKLHALGLFAAHGYDAVAVQDIVDAAGVAKPALHHSFGSKPRLLQALFEEELAALQQSLEQALQFTGDLVLTLRQEVQVHFDFAEGHRELYRFLLSAQHAPPESDSHLAAADMQHSFAGLLSGLFAQALPHMAGRSQRYASTLLVVINTTIIQVLQDDLVYSVVQLY